MTALTAKNTRVTLSNLPAEYEVELYNSKQVLIGKSLARGTANKWAGANNLAIGTYFVRVKGYLNAYAPSASY